MWADWRPSILLITGYCSTAVTAAAGAAVMVDVGVVCSVSYLLTSGFTGCYWLLATETGC